MVTISARSDEITGGTVEQAAAGDAVALARIIARYHDDMARVCVVICGGDREAAADAVQSAWPVVWRKLGSLRETDRLRQWLVAIAANEARQQQRRDRRRRVLEIKVTDAAPSMSASGRRDELADLSVALRHLDPDDRRLLALRYVAGLDSNEIGAAVGISPSGVRTRLERLLARLRKELTDE